ncbi:response regulator [bacterium]|nr:response regulator [bacterium]
MIKARIMIVEDEFIIQHALKNTLESLKYEVITTVSDGEEAIKKAEEQTPDIVLMDIRLDGKMDGIEAAGIISSRFNIPVVFLTAHAEEHYLEKAKLTHPYGYLIKPVQERDLKIAIEMALYTARIDQERKKAEEDAINQKNFLNKVLESLTHPFYVIDANDYSVIIANSAANRKGIKINQTCYSLTHERKEPCDGEEHLCPLKMVKHTKKPITVEHIHYDKEGNKVNVELHGFPIFDENGNVSQMIEYSLDISALKQLGEKLQIAKDQAEFANNAKSMFLANMSHELRTPLNGIIGFTQVLQKRISNKLDEKQMGYFSHIRESGAHLLEMVNDILDLSKIEAGRVEIQNEPFDFGEMLKRSPIIVKEIASQKGIQIDVNIQPDLGWINGDETKLKQVLYNLLSNAVKFTVPNKRVGIDAAVEGENFKITVWDQGIGIMEEDLNKVFDPFVQGVGGKTSLEKGTGLGLTISKLLVELHQGTLIVTSTPGEGSRFTLTLPGRIAVGEQNTQKNRVHENETAAGSTQNVKILVTEDNESNRELIKAALDDYQLDFAKSGEEAIILAFDNAYDLILMDIQLPGMDGIRVMKQIRKNHGNQVHIVALTAFAMNGDERKYLDLGFDDYISKPIDLELLRKKTLEHLQL